LFASADAAHAERFHYRFKPGQIIEFRANLAGAAMLGQTSGSMMKMQFRSGVRQTQRVRSVSGGIATLDVTETALSGKMVVGGKTEPMLPPPVRSLVKLTERGRFISRLPLTGPPGESGVGIEGADVTFGLNFPARDLKPGDTWQDTFEVGEGTERKRVHGAWKYESRERFRGRDCIRVSTMLTMKIADNADGGTGEAPLERGGMTARMITYFDPKAGSEVYSSGYLTLTSRLDLSAISPEAGELANVTKINLIQWLSNSPAKK
jgi:hypothetical protein